MNMAKIKFEMKQAELVQVQEEEEE